MQKNTQIPQDSPGEDVDLKKLTKLLMVDLSFLHLIAQRSEPTLSMFNDYIVSAKITEDEYEPLKKEIGEKLKTAALCAQSILTCPGLVDVIARHMYGVYLNQELAKGAKNDN